MLLLPARADLWTGFQAGGSDAASTTVTWTNLVNTLETTTNLISGVWTNAGYIVLGTNVMGGGIDYDEITNSIPTDLDEKYIRLKISTQ